jgi:hypothetical protein
MTLSILAAVTILVVGLFSIVARERKTSTSFNAVEQADLAVQAGLEQAGMLLKEALRDENGLIVSVPTAPWITQKDVETDSEKVLQSEEGRSEGATLMAMSRKLESSDFGSWAWTYTPLVSGVLGSETSVVGGKGEVDPVLNGLRAQARPILPGAYINGSPSFELVSRANPSDRRKSDGQKAEDRLALKRGVQKAVSKVAPWMRTPQQNWVEIALRDSENSGENGGEEVAARFSFHIEDLQGSLPLSTAGNIEPISGLHERTAFAFPPLMPSGLVDREKELLRWSSTLVPGMNLRRPQLPLLAETSLHTFFQPNVEPFAGNAVLDDVLNQMHRVVLRNRFMQVSPESWKEALLQPDTALGWPGLDEGSVQARDAVSGSLTNPVVRRIEEQTAPGLIPYDELALIPPDTAFSNLNRYRNPAAPTNFIAGPARKLNLNLWLRGIEAESDAEVRQERAREAVDFIASRIQDHLPFFAGSDAGTSNPNRMGRKGGYPLPLGGTNQQKARAYLQCLAAGIIDYADTDGVPTMDGDPTLKPEDDNGSKDKANQWADHYPRYRGIDTYPIVTKQWQRYRLESVDSGAAEYSITTYIELWNMTNQEISGEVSAAFEAYGMIKAVGFGGGYGFMEKLNANSPDEGVIYGKPVNESSANGLPDLLHPGKKLKGWWHAPIRMDDKSANAKDADQRAQDFVRYKPLPSVSPPVFKPMQPNEVRVLAFTPVVFKLKTSTAGGGTIASFPFEGAPPNRPIDIPNDRASRYRIAFRPSGAGGFMMVDQPLKPLDRLNRPITATAPQHFNLTLAGLSYAETKTPSRMYYNNVGDPRGAFFINHYQDYPNYEDASSPWARTIRDDQKTRMFGQNRIHLWPDGGHISRGPKNAKMPRKGIVPNSTNPDEKSLVPDWHAAKPNNLFERQKYVQTLSNAGRFFSVSELGHIFDPLMWDADGGGEPSPPIDPPNFYRDLANLRAGINATPSDKFCGGNTLRIGRPEHERFRPDYNLPAAPGRPSLRSLCATALLDLFHCGQPSAGWHNGELTADEIVQLTGDLVRIHGHVNLNTANRDTLRALVAGRLQMDPRLRRRPPNPNNEDAIAATPTLNDSLLYPPSSSVNSAQADLLAELIIRNRPYITQSELPEKVVMPTAMQLQQQPFPRDMVLETNQPGVVLEEGQPVLGATRRATDRLVEPEWNDAAAEETFARLFNNATVRSRNFKIVVTGQSVRRTRSGETKVLGNRSRLYHVFIRPIRDLNGNLIRQQTEITYARTL